MASTAEIVSYLDELLRPADFDDLGPNGLQVPGLSEVTRVVTGVSGQLELFEKAVELDAQMVLVHHGIFWDFHPRALTVQMAARLKTLLGADINLVAYHLPLDAHAAVGNNALIRERLGLDQDPEPFGDYRGQSLGTIGASREGLDLGQLITRIEGLVGGQPLVVDGGPKTIRRIGIVSGSAASTLSEAINLGLDAFVTGEPAEHVMAEAREGRIHFIAAGHYRTETLGVRRLGELLSEQFSLRHDFVDIPNPI